MTSPSSIPIHGPSKINIKRMLASIPVNAVRQEDTIAFAREVYRLGIIERVDINPLVPFAIARHETDKFRSDVLYDHCNFFGLFNEDLSDYTTFINGVDAARAIMVHLLMYTDGKAGRLGKYRVLDTGARRVVRKGFAGTVETLEDLREKWATDDDWCEGVVNHYNAIRSTPIPATNDRNPGYQLITNRVVPTGRINTPWLQLDAAEFVVHMTGNTSIGADAFMHNTFLWNGGGPESVSFHWVVDDEYVIQNVSTDYVTWQAGDGYYGPGNRRGESMEICVNADGDYVQALENAAHHIARRLKARGWGVDRVKRRPGNHRDYSGKYCPRELLNGKAGITWDMFVRKISAYMEYV